MFTSKGKSVASVSARFSHLQYFLLVSSSFASYFSALFYCDCSQVYFEQKVFSFKKQNEEYLHRTNGMNVTFSEVLTPNGKCPFKTITLIFESGSESIKSGKELINRCISNSKHPTLCVTAPFILLLQTCKRSSGQPIIHPMPSCENLIKI